MEVRLLPVISLAVAVLALTVSAITAWLTLLKPGTVAMTRPAVIFFGPDGGWGPNGGPGPKIYLRTLLYATSKRGRVLESMYERLRRRETAQNFNVWVYGEAELRRGSGLFVPDSGVTANHHFLLPQDGSDFEFTTGDYLVEVYASLVGAKSSHLLHSVRLTVSPEKAQELKQPKHGLYFDWSPESTEYNGHVRPNPEPELPPFLRELLK